MPEVRAEEAVYQVTVDGKTYTVEIDGTQKDAARPAVFERKPDNTSETNAMIVAPLAGNIFKVFAKSGDKISVGDVVIVMEAMKMETEISATQSGIVSEIFVSVGDKVSLGEILIGISS